MNFGQYAIVSDIKHVFEKEPNWWWIIRPPLGKDELEVSKLLSTDRTKVDADGTRVNQLVSTLEIAIREISVTFGGTNIPTSETDSAPLLKAGASLPEIEDVVKNMPREMIAELWVAVGEAVPGWGPAKPKTKN
jgi:hypothetical protein